VSNPIIPVHLSRERWATTNIIADLISVASIFTIRRGKQDDNTEP
jgi:hypothetical protein